MFIPDTYLVYFIYFPKPPAEQVVFSDSVEKSDPIPTLTAAVSKHRSVRPQNALCLYSHGFSQSKRNHKIVFKSCRSGNI